MPRKKIKPRPAYIELKIRPGGQRLPAFAKKLTRDSIGLVVYYLSHVAKEKPHDEYS